MLTGEEIAMQIQYGGIYIEDFDRSRLGPNSYNLRLSDELQMYTTSYLDMKKENPTHTITIPEHGYMLRPGILYLGKTMEWTETDSLIPMLEGRSSIGRLGLFVHVTAGFGDIGFKGRWTLEMHCIHPVMVYPGVEICQIYYDKPCGLIGSTYNGKYQKSDSVIASKMFEDFKE